MSDQHSALQIARQRLAKALAGPATGNPGPPPPAVRAGPGRLGKSGAGAPAAASDTGVVPVESRAVPVVESGTAVAPPVAGAVAQPVAGAGEATEAGPGAAVHAGAEPDEPAPATGLARLGAAAFDPGRPGLRALVVVAVAVLLGAAVLAWWSRPRPEPVAPQLAITASGTMASPASSAGPAELVVAVSGKVHRPGLVELPPGARVADAIEAAGGLLPGADIDHLNLARKVVDGELIAVGIPSPPGTEAGPPGTGAGPGTGAKVNLNTATVAELETLPGIGPALAQRIIDHRTNHGPFRSVTELREVSGIGEVRFAELADLVTV